MTYLEHHIQHLKDKEYQKASNDQRYINTHQEKVDILEDMMEAELDNRRKNMHCLEDIWLRQGRNQMRQ